METWEVVSVVSEVIGWIALGGSAFCLLLALLIRLADGRWMRTDAVVVDQEHGSTIRWFAEEPFPPASPGRRRASRPRTVMRPDEEPAFNRSASPIGCACTSHRRAVAAPIRILGFVLLAIAAIAGVVGFVLDVLALGRVRRARGIRSATRGPRNFSMSPSVPDTMMRS